MNFHLGCKLSLEFLLILQITKGEIILQPLLFETFITLENGSRAYEWPINLLGKISIRSECIGTSSLEASNFVIPSNTKFWSHTVQAVLSHRVYTTEPMVVDTVVKSAYPQWECATHRALSLWYGPCKFMLVPYDRGTIIDTMTHLWCSSKENKKGIISSKIV